jgi:hypothetical protein
MKYLLISLLLLTGCSTTVPVTAKFPNPPASIGKCDGLTKLNTEAKLSDVAETVPLTIRYIMNVL